MSLKSRSVKPIVEPVAAPAVEAPVKVRKKRVISDEQRAVLKERLVKARSVRLSNLEAKKLVV